MHSLLFKIHRSERLSLSLKAFSHAVSLLSAAALGYTVYLAAYDSLIFAAKLLAILAIPFLAVTVLRRVINAPRPYELYDFYEKKPKRRSGSSFPSRHAFSAVAIGTVLCFFSPILGAVLLALSLLMCASRVLLGIHFVRDVAAGALIGAISSLTGILVIC